MMALSRPFVVALGIALGCVAAVGAATTEYAIKAAYVYNFAKFVEWPREDPQTALTMCVYGKSPLEGFLRETVRGKLVHGLPLEVKRMSGEDEDWSPCGVVFFAPASREKLQTALNRLRGRDVLTIGESDAFAECGGMIMLAVEGERVRFDINLEAAENTRLKISSKLVQLGRKVRSGK